MSVSAKRELDSPAPESASKKRRTGDDRVDDDEDREDGQGSGEVERHNVKNLLRNGALPTGKAYQHRRIVLELYIPPIDTSDPLAGVERQLDDVLLTYIKEAEGILMGWDAPRFLDSSARILDESPFSYARVDVDAIIWRPRRGEELEGDIKLMGASHIGMLILGTFNASIPSHLIPPDWTFEEHFDGDGGNWKDGNGTALQLDGPLLFTTVNIKKGANILSVEGSLLDQVFQPKYQDAPATSAATPSAKVKTERPPPPPADDDEQRASAKREKAAAKETRARAKAERKAAKAARRQSSQA